MTIESKINPFDMPKEEDTIEEYRVICSIRGKKENKFWKAELKTEAFSIFNLMKDNFVPNPYCMIKLCKYKNNELYYVVDEISGK